MIQEKSFFNWISRSLADPEAPLIDETAQRFYTALRSGEQLKRLNRMRGTYQSCGCEARGFQKVFTPMVMDVKLMDASGTPVVLPYFAFHLVTCHRSKLNLEELALLASLPEVPAFMSDEIERLRRIAVDGSSTHE